MRNSKINTNSIKTKQIIMYPLGKLATIKINNLI